MTDDEKEIWAFLDRHLRSIFTNDSTTYKETTSGDLSLYEWFIAPHRMDGLDFHFFMLEHGWAGTSGDYRYDLLEPRLQLYGDTAIVSYTFMLTRETAAGLSHQQHNESRVMIRRDGAWQVVHVHKSPSWRSPQEQPQPK